MPDAAGPTQYLIFYRVEPDRVVVIHVLHGAMNYAELLFPDVPSG
jgi:toxin ParE1/3/4